MKDRIRKFLALVRQHPIATAFIVGAFVGIYALLVEFHYVGWKPYPGTEASLAMEIANGVYGAERNYVDPPDDDPFFSRPACRLPRIGEATVESCISIWNRFDYWRCGWWHFESCEVLEVSAFILTRPKFLGPTVAALHDPCRYLPRYAGIRKRFDAGENFAPTLGDFWRASHYFGCEGNPTTDEHRIILKFIDNDGKTVMTLETTRPVAEVPYRNGR